MNSVWADYTRMIFNVQVNVEGQPNGAGGAGAQQPAFAASGSATRAGRVSYSGGRSMAGAGAIAAAAAAAGVSQGAGQAVGAYAENGGEIEPELLAPVVEQRVVDDEHQVGRNDPCWCGSGKKFKKCHGA
jgi:preprotein translocase subunit SecA